MLNALQLHQEGVPLVDGQEWDPSSRDLNSWLTSLRQACCHPQVGKAAKVVLGRTLKTVEDVLESMRDKAQTTQWTDQRALLATRVRHAQLLCYDREECERFEVALDRLQGALLEVQPLVQVVSGEVKRAWRECKRRQKERDRIARQRTRAGGVDRKEPVDDDESDSDGDDDAADDKMDVDEQEPGNVGLALDGRTSAVNKALAETLGLGMGDEEEEGKEHGTFRSEADRAAQAKLSAMRNRLRELLFVEHNALFFSASAYYK